ERGAICECETNTGETLICEHSVAGPASAVDLHTRARRAGANTKVGLDAAAAIEVIKQVGHQAPCIHRTADVDIDGIGDEGRVETVVAIREFALDAESVGEAVADANIAEPTVFKIGVERGGVV